ncbi:MAG: hypothetical protein HFJ05_09920 [Eubacterium sp.]|nr:hypothetical protein [Eubacterium sp.]
MKKVIAFLLSFLMFLSVTSNDFYAREFLSDGDASYQNDTEVIYQDDEIVVTCTLVVWKEVSDIGLYSLKQTVRSTKYVSITTIKGKVLATYTLTGTFTYDGSTSTCTNAVCATSVHNTKWHFASQTAAKSGKKAIGSYILKNSSSNKSKSGQLTITCSKSGAIS